MERSTAAQALPVVIDHRLAAARVDPENAIRQVSAAADLLGGFAVVRVAAACEVVGIDGLVAAALVVAGQLLHDDSLAAEVRVWIVVTDAAAVRAVPTTSRVTATADRMPVIVRTLTTALCVGVVGLGLYHSVTADVAVCVVGVITAAPGTATVALRLQEATATEMIILVVDLPVAASVCRGTVDVVPAAGRQRAVGRVSHVSSKAADLRSGVVRLSAAAFLAVRRQVVETTTAPLVSLVVHRTIAAVRVIAVPALTYAVVGRRVRRMDI